MLENTFAMKIFHDSGGDINITILSIKNLLMVR